MDLNVIMLSVQHCGCSFVGAIISEAHKRTYGKPIYWNYEISRLIAIDPKYVLPEGYSTVYYVKLEWLLKKKYDKIIVLKMDKNIWLKNMFERYDHEDDIDFINLLEFYYDLVYDYNINDPRILEINWNDLNNYTVATWSEIFDHLKFNFEFRPLLIPSFRDPKKFGSILRKGHEEGSPVKQYSQYVNEERINPYKIAPEEYWKQEARVFRITPEGMPDILKIEGLI